MMNTSASGYDLIVVLGPTASGKTALAARVAAALDGEILSADSRQIYRKMDIGTGKDLDDYAVDGKIIPFHLINIREPGYKYSVYEYQTDFFNALDGIRKRTKFPVVCGGTGLYIEAVLSHFRMIHVPVNPELRELLNKMSLNKLETILSQFRRLHNGSDTDTKKRAVRAVEIETYYAAHPQIEVELPKMNPLIIGIETGRDTRREKITCRLHQRLKAGMVEEVQQLLNNGLAPDDLIYYGLEYKYLTLYLTGQLNYNDMVKQLNTAIHQFAKRQMTWFRRMERNGFRINWINTELTAEEKINVVLKMMTE